MNIVIKKRSAEIKELLSKHQTLSVMGMPGGGISVLLKELAKNDTGHAIYIDVFGLPVLTTDELFFKLATQLGIPNPPKDKSEAIRGCIRKIDELTTQEEQVTLYFAGFDQLADTIDEALLQGLQAIVRSNDRVRLVFGLCISTRKLIPDAYFDSGLRLFGNKYYIGNYSKSELEYWLDQYGPADWKKLDNVDEKVKLSGGHLQLLLLLLNEVPELSEGLSESTRLLFKNLYSMLLGPQRTIIRNSASGRKVPIDEYLNGIGMINNQGRLFSPLFAHWATTMHNTHLPAKEHRLYLLLKKNMGQIVSKTEIMEVVWKGEIISDWALNALVYRLRRHPSFQSKDLQIENHKKLGYRLVKNI